MAGGFPLSSLGQSLGSGGSLFGSAGGILGAASSAMPVIGAVASLAPSIFKAISGISQRRKGNKMNPIDPGYQMNQGVLQNRDILQNNYGNYEMPGYSRASGKIGSAYGSAFNNGVNGASSSGDVLDLATKLAYGQSQAIGDLETENAMGKERARGQFLNANAMAGEEAVKKNEYDRMLYQQKLREKAALTQSGTENIYGAMDQGASVAGAYLNPKKSVSDPYSSNTGNMAAILKYMKDNNIQI